MVTEKSGKVLTQIELVELSSAHLIFYFNGDHSNFLRVLINIFQNATNTNYDWLNKDGNFLYLFGEIS
ncbi:MAG: hypothetical protein N2517_07435 [Ignavibacteria bacterium]|nr:hypothetical protein [Ignavibacteria bacterium]